jgi:FAD:protein FMN transferase
MMSALPGRRRIDEVMGMPIVVDVRDDCGEEALDVLFDWFREVDERFSTYKLGSEISRLNRGELAVRECHPDVRAVLALCDELREETEGFFDARYASLTAVDPSGLVKGWSVDRGGALLERLGIANYSINAGGDIRTRGRALPEAAWRTGIQHPVQLDRIAAIVEANDLALATSGTYVRGEHIVDPHSGRPASGLLSITIAGDDLATADAYATAAFAMGEHGAAWASTRGPYQTFAILGDGTSVATSGFPFGEP